MWEFGPRRTKGPSGEEVSGCVDETTPDETTPDPRSRRAGRDARAPRRQGALPPLRAARLEGGGGPPRRYRTPARRDLGGAREERPRRPRAGALRTDLEIKGIACDFSLSARLPPCRCTVVTTWWVRSRPRATDVPRRPSLGHPHADLLAILSLGTARAVHRRVWDDPRRSRMNALCFAIGGGARARHPAVPARRGARADPALGGSGRSGWAGCSAITRSTSRRCGWRHRPRPPSSPISGRS